MQHDFLLQNSNDNINSEENDLTMSQTKPGADVDVHKLGVLKIHICYIIYYYLLFYYNVHKLGVLKIHICEAGQCCKNLLRIFEGVHYCCCWRIASQLIGGNE